MREKNSDFIEVRIDRKAFDELASFERIIQDRILRKLEIAKTNPLRYFERLEDSSIFKLRVGDYRVIADISKNLIEVRLIGHRKNVYD